MTRSDRPRWWRSGRSRWLASGIAVLAVTGLVAYAAASGGPSQTVKTEHRDLGPAAETDHHHDETAEQTVAEAPDGTPSTTIACVNGRQPECGQFRWMTPPKENQALFMQLKVSPAKPSVGGEIALDVTLQDPDSTPSFDACEGAFAIDWGDGVMTPPFGCSTSGSCGMWGPWAPPPPKPTTVNQAFTHVYKAPGEYRIAVRAASHTTGVCHKYDPYGSRAESSLRLNVASA
jgi:hypothetical protein